MKGSRNREPACLRKAGKHDGLKRAESDRLFNLDAPTGDELAGEYIPTRVAIDWAPHKHSPIVSEAPVKQDAPTDEEEQEMRCLQLMFADGFSSRRPRALAPDMMISMSLAGGAARISPDHKTFTIDVCGGKPMGAHTNWDSAVSSGSEIPVPSWAIGAMQISEGVHSWEFTIDRCASAGLGVEPAAGRMRPFLLCDVVRCHKHFQGSHVFSLFLEHD